VLPVHVTLPHCWGPEGPIDRSSWVSGVLTLVSLVLVSGLKHACWVQYPPIVVGVLLVGRHAQDLAVVVERGRSRAQTSGFGHRLQLLLPPVTVLARRISKL
jgi:hypothetical protein